jgi:hypothetical protein
LAECIAGGIVAALALARYMQSMLFGISAVEQAVLASIAILRLVVAAWRTTRLSPTLARRNH